MKKNAYYIMVSCLALITGCSLAPEFHPPTLEIPKTYKEEQGKWLPADVKAAAIERGAWWKVYKDPDLDALEEKISGSNQSLKAALARYDEARSIAAQARAGYFPTLTANAGAQPERESKTIADAAPHTRFNDFLLGTDLSYELDVWGKVRNAVKSQEALAKASAADAATIDVSLHAELAMDYFALRGDDASQIVLDKITTAYEQTLKLTQARHDGGIASESDVDLAITQLQNAKTQAADMHLQRATLEHAIAVLVGAMPSGFTIEAKTQLAIIPPQAPDLPSTLLERRPDIAAAILRVESANADIGVAKAAYYPDFTLNGSFGLESAVLPQLFSASSLFWAFGPAATMPLFDGGKINALNDQARAAYNEAVANYRQTVLSAFQNVEDSLASLRQLSQEEVSQKAAVEAAKRSMIQTQDRYKGGIATPLDVVIVENTELQTELSAIDTTTRHLTASVMLIKALGGGWHVDDKPNDKK